MKVFLQFGKEMKIWQSQVRADTPLWWYSIDCNGAPKSHPQWSLVSHPRSHRQCVTLHIADNIVLLSTIFTHVYLRHPMSESWKFAHSGRKKFFFSRRAALLLDSYPFDGVRLCRWCCATIPVHRCSFHRPRKDDRLSQPHLVLIQWSTGHELRTLRSQASHPNRYTNTRP